LIEYFLSRRSYSYTKAKLFPFSITYLLKHIALALGVVAILLLQSTVLFAQKEPKPARIWKVNFEGNTTYENMVINKFIANESPSAWKKLTFFNEKGYYVSETEIKRDVIRIQRFYNKRGFSDVKVSYRLEDGSPSWRKTLIFYIVEGKPILVESVNVEIDTSPQDSLLIAGDDNFQRVLRRASFRKNNRFETVEIPETEGDISQALRNLGFAYAETKISAEVDSLKGLATVDMQLTTGPRARFDSILVEGESTLPEKYIARETGLTQGVYYNEKDLREAQRELFNHHLFRFAIVSVPEQPQDTTLNVLIRVKEMPLRSVQFKAGLGNFDRVEPPIDPKNGYRLFRGEIVWIYRNVRQKGERFRTSLRVSGFEQNFGFDYLFPYLFNTKSSFITTPFIQHKIENSYEILRGGLTNNFIYEHSQNLTSSFGYEFSNNQEVSRKIKTTLPDSVLNYNVSSFRLNAYYTKGLKGDREGWVVQPYAEISGTLNESSFQFQKLSLDVRRYFEVNSALILATRVSGGGIFSAERDSLPQDIRFFTGGTNSVRGWSRQNLGPKEAITDSLGAFQSYVSTGGNAFFNFNIEFRQRLDAMLKGFGVAAFFDGGQVWKSLSAIDTGSLQFGTGAGIRYKSPIGPIRLDIAYKINPTKQDLNIYNGNNYGSNWNRWGFHLSIGQAF